MVAPHDPAGGIDHADPIGIAVERDAQIGAPCLHGFDERLQILDDGWIRMVVGERPVALAEEIARVESQASKQLAGDEGARAVATVEDHAQTARQRARSAHDIVDIPIDHGHRPHGAVATLKHPSENHRQQVLDLVTVQRLMADAQLESVVFRGIVRAGDLDPAHDRLLMQRPVHERGRHDAQVEYIDSAAGEARHQAGQERIPTRAIVTTHCHRPVQPTLDQHGGIPATDGPRRLRREVTSHDSADIVLAKNAGRDRHRPGAIGATGGRACAPLMATGQWAATYRNRSPAPQAARSGRSRSRGMTA